MDRTLVTKSLIPEASGAKRSSRFSIVSPYCSPIYCMLQTFPNDEGNDPSRAVWDALWFDIAVRSAHRTVEEALRIVRGV